MKITKVSREDLERALAEVNEDYEGNVIFKSLKSTNCKKTIWQVSLRVKSSSGPGARTSVSGRKSISACWHVHGEFVDALPSEAIAYTGYYGKGKRSPGEPWQDVYCGSQMNNVHMSSLCEC